MYFISNQINISSEIYENVLDFFDFTLLKFSLSKCYI